MNVNEQEKQTSQFRNAMLDAFLQGMNFESFMSTDDLNPETTPDYELPFSEWFAKNYQCSIFNQLNIL